MLPFPASRVFICSSAPRSSLSSSLLLFHAPLFSISLSIPLLSHPYPVSASSTSLHLLSFIPFTPPFFSPLLSFLRPWKQLRTHQYFFHWSSSKRSSGMGSISTRSDTCLRTQIGHTHTHTHTHTHSLWDEVGLIDYPCPLHPPSSGHIVMCVRWMSPSRLSFCRLVGPMSPQTDDHTDPGAIFPFGKVSSTHHYLIFSLNGSNIMPD